MRCYNWQVISEMICSFSFNNFRLENNISIDTIYKNKRLLKHASQRFTNFMHMHMRLLKLLKCKLQTEQRNNSKCI